MTKNSDIYNITQDEYRSIKQTDSIVDSIVDKFVERASKGKSKYGHTLDRTDLKPIEWIQHFQEELMDGILYCEKLKQEFISKD